MKNLCYKENAYFTVEAALVLPMVIGTLLFVIYSFLFQYDRCLLEQDLGAMALWGGCVEESDTKTFEQMMQERMTGIYRDKYAAWSFTELEAGLKKNYFSVKGAAQLTFPLSGWRIWNGGNVWSAEAAYKCRRFSPVTFIRLCRRVKDTIQND